jgi:hypothetical protein
MFSFFLLLELTSEFLIDVKSRIFNYFECTQLNSFILAHAREVESKSHQIELMGQDYKEKKESHNLLRKIEDLELGRQQLEEGASSSADDLQQLCGEVTSSLPFASGNICRRTI